MNNHGPLRRSRRGQKQEYGPGDKVEVVRDEGIAIGRLVRKVDQDSDSESNVVHWIVSFVGDAEEHEVTEKYIGRLVESSETESVKSTQSTPTSTPIPASTTKGETITKSKITATSRNRRDKSPPRKTKSPPIIVKEEVRPSTRSTIKQPVKQPLKQNGAKKASVVKCIKTVKKPPLKVVGSKTSGENETVVKVKMLTGTLYLYRGDRPRAEFIRTV